MYLFTIRDERPPTVDTRHQNRCHCTKLCIPETTFQNIGVQRNVLDQLANGMRPSSTSSVTSQHCVPLQLPTIKIGLSSCKCDHIFCTSSWIVQVPILFANQTLNPGLRPKSVDKTCSPRALKILLPHGLMDAHPTVSTLSSQFLSSCD